MTILVTGLLAGIVGGSVHVVVGHVVVETAAEGTETKSKTRHHLINRESRARKIGHRKQSAVTVELVQYAWAPTTCKPIATLILAIHSS